MKLNTILHKEDAERFREMGYTASEGDHIEEGLAFPTLASAQQFLRERQGIIVTPECISYGTWRYSIVREDWKSCTISEPVHSDANYVSHDYALLAGIGKALSV